MTSDRTGSFARARVAAGALFFDAHSRVLLAVPAYKPYRDIPGGYVEHGETPREAAIREIREELAIYPRLGRLLVLDWAPNETEGDKLLFVFDGGVLSAADRRSIRLDPRELISYDFHDVEQVIELTIARLARRILHGHAARRDGSTRYLEHGELTT